MLVVIKREEKTPNKGKKKKAEKESKPMFNVITLSDEGMDKELFEELRVLRKRLADEQGIPPYIILTDKTLHLIAIQRPTTLEAFGMVSGIGEYKKEKYGKVFVEAIRNFLQ